MTTTLRRITTLATAAVLAGTAITATAGAADRADRLTSEERRTVHEATKRYRDLDVALADGYVPAGGCVAEPELGGMGYHYLHPGLAADPDVDPAAPEILVYTPHPDGTLRLAAVEWWVPDADQDLATDDDRPELFDRLPFDGPMPGHDPEMPVHYDLHVWLYKHNPAGQLAPFNPKVSCDV